MSFSRLRSIRTTEALLASNRIDPENAESIREVVKRYAVAITPAMQQQMTSPDDPLGRQFRAFTG